MTDAPALPTLPKDFEALTAHLSIAARETELAARRKAFNAARMRLQQLVQQDRRIPPTAKLIVAYLLDCVNFTTGRCNPSHEAIGDRFGITTRQVRRLLPVIRQAGWISYRRASFNRPTFYTLHAPTAAIECIEDRAAILKQERDRRRSDRTKMSAQPPVSDRTFKGSSDRTFMSAEPMKGTSDTSSTSHREVPKVSAVEQTGETPASNVVDFASVRRGAA